MREKIYKLQRPLCTNGDMNEIMIYDETGFPTFVTLTDEEIEELFGEDYKVYVLAKITPFSRKLKIFGRVEEQDW